MKGYRWDPGSGLFEIEDDRVVRVLDVPASPDPRTAAARRLLADVERVRLNRERPDGMLDRMAGAFAGGPLGGPPGVIVTVAADDVLAWIDGPGLDVILAFVLSRPGR